MNAKTKDFLIYAGSRRRPPPDRRPLQPRQSRPSRPNAISKHARLPTAPSAHRTAPISRWTAARALYAIRVGSKVLSVFRGAPGRGKT